MGGNSALNLVVFASREQFPALGGVMQRALDALGADAAVDVLVNGNPSLALSAARWAERRLPAGGPELRVWSFDAGDKGNAWNQHLHGIWRRGDAAIYIDGYVLVDKSSIDALVGTLRDNPTVLGTSGVPTQGPSAAALRRRMLIDGGFHGNFCALGSRAIEEIRRRGIRIPLGMYRVDSLIGALLSFGLSDTDRVWEPHRHMPVTPEASWALQGSSSSPVGLVRAWLRRRERQAQGDIENAAVSYHLASLRVAMQRLPPVVSDLVAAWAAARPEESQRMIESSARHRRSWQRLQDYRAPETSNCVPTRVG